MVVAGGGGRVVLLQVCPDGCRDPALGTPAFRGVRRCADSPSLVCGVCVEVGGGQSHVRMGVWVLLYADKAILAQAAW
jgi:hypothetical protein